MVRGVPSNFFDVADTEFYLPDETQDVSGVGKTSDGKVNIIESLFSTEDLYTYPTYPEYDQDYYHIGVQEDLTYNLDKPTSNIPIMLSYGLKNALALEAGQLIKWETHYDSSIYYMATVRGLVTKFPGFFFSGLNTVLLNNQAVISMDSYKQLQTDIYKIVPDAEGNLRNNTEGFEFFDDIPKQELFVKLSPTISASQRQFIANGIRNFFTD